MIQLKPRIIHRELVRETSEIREYKEFYADGGKGIAIYPRQQKDGFQSVTRRSGNRG